MRSLLAGLFLFIAGSASAIPGDVAPAGSPDGVLDISDVLLTLSMAVGSTDPDLVADLAPASAFGSSRLIGGDGAIDIADLLLLLRVVVGLDFLAGGTDVDQATSLALVRAARFGFDGFWAIVNAAIAGGGDPPPIGVPTQVGCADGGSVTVLLAISAQSIEAMNCDTGSFEIDGLASRQGSLLDPVLDLDVDFDLVNAIGTLNEAGLLATEPGVEFEPGRTGALLTSLLDVVSSYPSVRTFSQEGELVKAADRDWPIGRMWTSFPDGPGVELVFDGSSTATATAKGPTVTRGYRISLVTGVVTEL